MRPEPAANDQRIVVSHLPSAATSALIDPNVHKKLTVLIVCES
jgi:hypothetical protein